MALQNRLPLSATEHYEAASSHLSTYESLRDSLVRSLEDAHGPLLGGAVLASVLGHRTTASLRQAHYRGQLTVPVFTLPNKRGLYGLSRDIAEFLAKARLERPVASGKGGPRQSEI